MRRTASVQSCACKSCLPTLHCQTKYGPQHLVEQSSVRQSVPGSQQVSTRRCSPIIQMQGQLPLALSLSQAPLQKPP